MADIIKFKAVKIIDKLAELLADDQEIIDFSNDNFSKDHSVIIGFDAKNPPEQSLMPNISIIGIASSEIKREAVYRIFIGYTVFKKSFSNSPPSRIHTYDGFRLCEQFRELCESVLRRKFKGAGKLEFESQTEANESYPVFTSNSILAIIKNVSMDGAN